MSHYSIKSGKVQRNSNSANRKFTEEQFTGQHILRSSKRWYDRSIYCESERKTTLLFDGHLYLKDKPVTTRIYWQCEYYQKI